MDDKIVSKYIMKVWESGKVEIEPLEQLDTVRREPIIENDVKAFHIDQNVIKNVSSRARQFVFITELSLQQLLKISEPINTTKAEEIVREAIRNVAENEKEYNNKREPVRYATALSKICVQTFNSVYEYIDALLEFHNTKGMSDTLEQKIIKRASDRSVGLDRDFIRAKFKEFRTMY